MNIGELAKELNVSGKDVIAFLQGNGFPCKSSKKNLDADTEALVRKNVSKIGQLSSDAETQPSKKNSKEKNDNTDVLNEEKAIKEEKTKTEEKAIKQEMSKTEEKLSTSETNLPLIYPYFLKTTSGSSKLYSLANSMPQPLVNLHTKSTASQET